MPPKNSTPSSNAAAAAAALAARSNAAAGSTAQVASASGCSYASSFSPRVDGATATDINTTGSCAADGIVELGVKPLGKCVLSDQELTMQHALAETPKHHQAPAMGSLQTY
jgi:hypothetical protein